MWNNKSNFDEDRDVGIIEDPREELESDSESTIIQAYNPKYKRPSSSIDNATIIEKFARGEREIAANENLQIDLCFNRLQLTTRKLEILGLIDLLDKPRIALIKASSDYEQLIQKILLKNSFVPWGEASRPGFIKYQQCVPPKGYKLNYTEALDLWKAWWPNRRVPNKHKLELDILVFFKTNWYPIKDISSGHEGTFFIKILAGEMTLHSTDKVVWVSRVPKEITLESQSPTASTQPGSTASVLNITADNKPIISEPFDRPSLGQAIGGIEKQESGRSGGAGTADFSVVGAGLEDNFERKQPSGSSTTFQRRGEPQPELKKPAEPDLEGMLAIVKKKAMQTLANYLVNGVTETTTEEMKNLKGETISTKTITVKKACPQWVIEHLLNQ